MPTTSWVELISNVGVPVAILIVLLVWIRIWINAIMKQFLEREQRMGARLDSLEAEYRRELKTALNDSTAATQENYRCQRRLTTAVTQLFNALRVHFNLSEHDLQPTPSPLGPLDPHRDDETRDHRP